MIFKCPKCGYVHGLAEGLNRLFWMVNPKGVDVEPEEELKLVDEFEARNDCSGRSDCG